MVAERLCEAAEQTQVGDDELGPLGRFTVSVGVAGFPLHCDDADELASLAEGAVRQARLRGGGCVVTAAGRPEAGPAYAPSLLSAASASSVVGSPASTIIAAPSTRAVMASTKYLATSSLRASSCAARSSR